MRTHKNLFLCLVLFTVVLLNSSIVQGQQVSFCDYQYLSPSPGSKYVMPGNSIALRHGDVLDKESISSVSIQVTGSESGHVNGKIVLSDDQRTILFYPNQAFKWGEEVHVQVQGSPFTETNKSLNPVDYSFFISKQIPEMPENYVANEEFNFHQRFFGQQHSRYAPLNKSIMNNNLPEDFPDLTMEVLNETSDNGHYFVCPFGYWGWYPDNIPYLIIFDDRATPVFYRRLEDHGYDFKLNVNGKLSYYQNLWPLSHINILNSSYEKIDEYTMQNGYSTDFHEFFMMENDHVIIMAYDPQLVDMSAVVSGGDPNAIVTGWVFQELDASKNVVFQWRSWDHYDILDAEGYVNLQSSSIDLVHGNAIEITPDGEYMILSPRNFQEFTKIDRNSGEIVWRLNGNNNMFEFTNDTLRFHWAHDCRILENGNLSLFDNGEENPGLDFSSMVEYELDEENMTATLVRRLRNQPEDIFGVIMGNSQETTNGNIVNGWGSGEPGVTEFNEEGEVAAVYSFAGINYRAYRDFWTSDYFEVNKETLNYGYVWQEDQKTKNIKVKNNQDFEISLTSYHLHDDKFMIENEFPILVPAGGEQVIQVTFVPGEEGSFTDRLTINSDINEPELVQRVAQQVDLIGHATAGQGIGDGKLLQVSASPNPVKNKLKLDFGSVQEQIEIVVFDHLGQQVLVSQKYQLSDASIDMSKLASGLYFIEIRDLSNANSTTLKVIKD